MTALRRRLPDPRQLCLLDLSEMSWVATKPANDVPSPAPLPDVVRRKRRVPYQMPLFEGHRPYVIGQSYGVCQILRSIGGDATSGAQRANLTVEIDDLMLKLYGEMEDEHGSEQAALSLFTIVAGSSTYRHPDWMLSLWVEHKEALMEEFSGSGSEAVLPAHDVYEEADEES